MKNTFIINVLLVLAIFCSTDALAIFNSNQFTEGIPDSTADASVKWSIESDCSSNYLWKGIDFQDALTWNPGFTIGKKNFSAVVWTNVPIHFYNSEDQATQDFNEVDVNLNYEIENEVSYTMIAHSAQFYTPLGTGDWYWGMVNVFQGFYRGPIGFYINPEVNYYPFAGGLYVESGFNYAFENDNSKLDIYLAYATANRIFTTYNICGFDEKSYTAPFQNIKFEASYQYKFKSVFIRPHFTYFHLINYTENLGYKNNFSFGLAIGYSKN